MDGFDVEGFVAGLRAMDVAEPGFPSSGQVALMCEGLARLCASPDADAADRASDALTGTFRRMAAGACAGTMQAVLQGRGDRDARMAYAMGMLDMARAMTVHARHHAEEAGIGGPSVPGA